MSTAIQVVLYTALGFGVLYGIGRFTPKILTVILSGSTTTIVVWILKATKGIEVPGEVAAAFTTLIVTLSGYIAPRSTVTPPPPASPERGGRPGG